MKIEGLLELLLGMLIFAMLAMHGRVEAVGKKKVQLNKTSVTLTVKKTVQLKLKNAPKGKKIKWSSSLFSRIFFELKNYCL